ncbi:hypothetical protein GQ457_02G039520 [Hibiscus cannabinus]
MSKEITNQSTNSSTIDLGDGLTVGVGVELDWSPPRCHCCYVFGHLEENCPNKKVSASDLIIGEGGLEVGVESVYAMLTFGIGSLIVDGGVGSTVGAPEIAFGDGSLKGEGFVGSSVGAPEIVSGDGNLEVGVGASDGGNYIFGDGDKLSIVVSPNRFDNLSSIEVDHVVSPRKERLAAAGVGDLLNQLKAKGKGGGPKNNKKGRGKKGVLCLLETRVKESNASVIVGKCFMDWNFVYNYYDALNEGSYCFHVSFVYGHNGREERLAIWEELVGFKVVVGDRPWAIAGDFNIINCPQESSDFDGSQVITGAMKEFLNCQEKLDVVDHPFTSSLFTWCNQREGNPLSRKLDRFLVTQSWLDSFPAATVEFLLPDCSDHCSCCMTLSVPLLKPPRPFKIFNFWAEHPEFLNIVEESWKEFVPGNPKQVLFGKLKRLKAPLRKFNREVFGEISKRVVAKQLELENIQKFLLVSPSGEMIAREKQAAMDLKALIMAEESFFRQKSRVQFVKEGDQNTSFFFRKVQIQQKANTISSLYNSEGVKLESFGDISSEFVKYFSDSLGSVDDSVDTFSDDLLKQILGVELSAEIRDALVAHKEIKDVLFSMNESKAPGPDGFSARFFQAAWGIVGADFLRAVQFFFGTSSLPDAFNSTILTLVPKVAIPLKATDFRPISCCSSIYKCITKLLANRLKVWLPFLILPNQSTFLGGRDLVDNVLLAQEIVHGAKTIPLWTVWDPKY